MDDLLTNLQNLLTAGWHVVISLLVLILPWTPLLAWVAFWLLAVNWVKLREVMIRGGWIGVVLIGFMMVMIWSVVAPPESGSHYLFGLNVSNFVGKTVYVTALLTILFLCGSVQLSGACGSLAQFPETTPPEHDAHGHDAHEQGSDGQVGGHSRPADTHGGHAHAH